MNRIICILNFLLLINVSNAQEKSIIIFGKAKNTHFDTIVLSNHYGKYSTITDQNGEYRFALKIKDPDFLNFNILSNNATIFVLAGDTLEMDFNNNDFERTLSFKGQRAKINSELLSISRGKQAPDFSFSDINGKIVNLSDFKGKYVYIDIWNSACGPCFKEFPYMETLVEKYKEKDIVFLGISLDTKKEKWLKTLEKRKLKGVQLFGNGWNSEFTTRYFIKFNPRFVLIDKNQQIIFLSAPRPSDNMDEILRSLVGM